MLKITTKGLETIEAKLSGLEQKLREIRKEKATAYVVSGDTWHDNPGFKQLEQEEERVVQQITKIEEKLNNIEIVEEFKDSSTVVIGSIVKCKVTEKSGVDEITDYTIVGFSESDPFENKISYDTLIGETLMGKKKGDKLSVETLDGLLVIDILDIK